MIERDNLEALQKKLSNICEENQLICVSKLKQYPITFIIEPDTSLDAQMSLLEDGEHPSARGSYWRIVYDQGLKPTFDRGGQFKIRSDLESRIIKAVQKVFIAWINLFYVEYAMNKSTAPALPVGQSEDEPEKPYTEAPPDDLDNNENFEGLPDDDGDLDESEE